MKGQLDEKYRKMSGDFSGVIGAVQVDSVPDLGLDNTKRIIQELQSSFGNSAALFESDLLPDLIHMSLNRAFRTRHRLQELVVYDFMRRYYESMKARGIIEKRDA
jgi:hypothetical protein